MNGSPLHDETLDLCRRLDIEVRHEHLGGDGGAICSVKGRRVLFVDLDDDLATQLHRCMVALSELREVETMYLSPALRDALLRAGERGSGP